MIYLEHSEYGPVVVSRMPKRDIDKYTVITKEKYDEYMKQLEEQNNEDK